MPELGRFARELRARLWKPSVHEEVESELAHHLEMMERDLVAQGVTPNEARVRARARFGDVPRIEADCRDLGEARDRDARLTRWLDELRHDLRDALRQLRIDPRFTLVATLTLALGLGASTTIFGIADAVLLRKLPFVAPDRLAVAWETTPAGQPFSISEPDYLDWRARTRRFSDVGGFMAFAPNVLFDGGPEQLSGAAATASMFRVLGVRPALGRTFQGTEDQPGGDHRVAVIGDALWTQRFGRDPRVLGRTLDIDGVRHRIIGVMPPGFDFPGQVALWTPLAPSPTWPRGDRRLDALVGRLAPNATREQAAAELKQIAGGLATDFPSSNAGWGADARPFQEWYVSPELRTRVLTLLAAVVLLLGMACVNVASLLLARAGTRERATALRAALGAGRARIVRQLLTESVVLALVGAVAGIALAAAAVPLIRATGSAAVPQLATLHIDWRMLSFALAACVLTGVTFGLAPALRLARGGTRNTLHTLLRSGTRIADSGRVRSGLIVASVALATLMLVGAGLVGGSFARLLRTDLGFRADRVLTGSIALPESRYDRARVIAFYDALLPRIAQLPGVRVAGAVNLAPYAGGNTAMGFVPGGVKPLRQDEFRTASWRVVTPGYFDALGITLRRGRLLDDTDRYPGEPTMVINERMAALGWPNANPVGQQVTLGNGRTMRIVGVVRDARLLSVDSAAAPTIYYPSGQFPWNSMWLTIRTTGDPTALAAAVRRTVASMDPALPVAQLQPLAQLVSNATAQPRLTALVFAIFAASAVTLAAVGLFGLIAYTVAQRTREIGVRLALGAPPRRIVGAVLSHGMRLAALGVAFGVLTAYEATGVLRSILYEIEPADVTTFAAVAFALLAVAALASALPARRASRLDPVTTLRAE